MEGKKENEYGMEIVDFHVHPFWELEENLCFYQDTNWTKDRVLEEMNAAGIQYFCGSVISKAGGNWNEISKGNQHALCLREYYSGRYLPGIHIHPGYVRESCEAVETAAQAGIRLIGELVPYLHGWEDYSSRALAEILEAAEKYGMVVSAHPMNMKQMEQMVEEHPNTTFVFAHPGEPERVAAYLAMMRRQENVCLDLSGTGLFRYGLVHYLVNQIGAERIVFGSDYPICGVQMYVAGVLAEKISDREKEAILGGNAKRILQIA